MENTRERLGAAGLALAGGIFKLVLYACVVVFIFWVGRTTYGLAYDVFNQQAMSPGEGQEVSVVIPEGTSVYGIGKILETDGLIKNALVFYVQERMSNYHGQLQPGTWLLSTAYTPNRIMEIMTGAGQEPSTVPQTE